VITDLGELRREGGELVLARVHPGVDPGAVVAATGWDLTVAPDLEETPAPTAEELTVLRHLDATRGQAA
jgi:glutaconate CoA-transferase subunit B